MARARDLEAWLAALRAIRDDLHRDDATRELSLALQCRFSHAVARAADLVAEAGRRELENELVAAFERLLEDPVKKDPGCEAKTRLAEALQQMACAPEKLFLAGIRHHQIEPLWPKSIDTAVELRGACAWGLVRMASPHALVELTDLLADAEAPARAAAAQALGASGREGAIPLLRLKIHFGDAEGQVLTECMTGLLQLDAEASRPFVAAFLDQPNLPRQESAALALGTARDGKAFPILRDWWTRTPEVVLRRTALWSIALLKTDEALAFLREQIATGSAIDARDAAEAFAMYRHDPRLAALLRDSAQSRSDHALEEHLSRLLSDLP